MTCISCGQMRLQTCTEEGQEVVVWERSHALCDDVAGKAELHGYAASVEMLFQVIIQAAHVAQSVWPEVQNLLCL